nr:hypothetical protein [Rhizobium bangladeshense]
MKRSRHISVIALASTVIVAGVLLLEQTGIFAGVFRTEILARVDDGDVARPSPTAGMPQDNGALDKGSTR